MRRITSSYHARELLSDGQMLHVRAIRPDDRGRLREEFLKLSKATVRDRFFSLKMDLTPGELTYYTEVDFSTHVALVAEIDDHGERRPVGVGRFVRDGEDSDHCEAAITIVDAYQGRGIGRLLLRHLIRCARKLGIRYLDATVLAENTRMSRLLHGTGLPLQSSMRDGVISFSLSLQPGWTRRLYDLIMARVLRLRGGSSGTIPAADSGRQDPRRADGLP